MRPYLVALLVAATAQAQHPNLTPEKRAEARQHYEDGLRKFDVSKFDEAVKEFVAAYEIIGDASILYNIAQSYRLGEQYEKALFFYKSFERHIDPKAPASLRAEVAKRIKELEVTIEQAKHAATAPPTGTIRSEPLSEPRPQTSKPPETTKPPEVTTHPETTRPERTRPPEVRTSPETVPPPTPEATPPAAEQKPSSAMKYAGFALAGVAVVGIAVGAGMSGAAAKDSQNLEDASKQHDAFGPHLQASEKNGQLYDTLSYVFYGVGGAAAVAAAVTLYFGLRHPSSARAQISPTVGPNQAGLVLTGRF